MASRSPARYLAPAALAAAAVAVYLVGFNGSQSKSDSGDAPASRAGKRTTSSQSKPAAKKAKPTTYTVRAGDVLSGIAGKTGVSVDDLQRFNPKVDAQTLRVGQKLKLQP
jgi:LysM repeat protein